MILKNSTHFLSKSFNLPIETFKYNALGNKIEATTTKEGESKTTTYNYDSMNRLISENQADGKSITYSYDNVGNKIQTTLNDDMGSSTTTYSYDKLNRLIRVTSPHNQTTTYSYNKVGSLSQTLYDNGNKDSYSYDKLNRVTNITTTNGSNEIISSFDYTLDSVGNRIELVQDNNQTTTYSYDKLNRLVTETLKEHNSSTTYTATYSYDVVGNMISSIIDGVTTHYTYDKNDRLLQQGGTTYEYDANGNLIKESIDYTNKTYSYNAKNKLTQITKGSDTIKYDYNIDNIRISKNINDSNITHYLVDSNRDYAQVLKEYQNDTTIEYTYGHDLIAQTTNDITYNYHYDALGSTRNLTNQNGEIVSSYDYEAYGKLRSHQGDVNVSYLYTGEQYNPESGNYYLRAREYNPTTKRFTQQDRYEGNPTNPLTLNKYLYANANPTNMVDPTGYYSMASVMMANDIRASMQRLQLEAMMSLTNLIQSIVDPQRNNENLYVGLIASTVGMNFLLRFSPKYKKARALCRNSFDGNTLIATSKGLKTIRDIQIGDKVWAYNENNKTTSLQEVVNLIQGTGLKQLTAITLENNETIIATNNHPIYSVMDNNWTDARNLGVNDILLNIKENNISIKYIQRYSKETTVYNLTVDNDHTYFVGNSGVLGHNCDINHNVVKKLIADIPEDRCGMKRCDQFKNSFVQRLRAYDIDYEIIKLEQPDIQGIHSKKAKQVIGGDYHYGVKVGDKVYDNLTREGMLEKDWLIDLWVGDPYGPKVRGK